MKAFVVTDEQGDGEVTVLDVFILEDREESRRGLKGLFGSKHVWFSDECGTPLDPIRGPVPLFGPAAGAPRN